VFEPSAVVTDCHKPRETLRVPESSGALAVGLRRAEVSVTARRWLKRNAVAGGLEHPGSVATQFTWAQRFTDTQFTDVNEPPRALLLPAEEHSYKRTLLRKVRCQRGSCKEANTGTIEASDSVVELPTSCLRGRSTGTRRAR
jgi:hypothetical protein